MSFSDINSWLSTNQLAVTLVIMPAISALAAWYAARKAVSSAQTSRIHQSAIEIASYRQEWVNGFRDDLAELAGITAIAYIGNPPAEKIERVSMLAMRIQMRMNPDDPDYNAMYGTLMKTTEQFMFGNQEKDESFKPIVPVSQEILKREWDRVKRELREAAK